MKRFVFAFAALALFAAVGQAAPLELKNVAADAKWVVHINVDAVRDSQIVKKAFETCPMLKDSGKHFDMIRDKVGIDLRKDLHGITLYGPDTDKTHGVAIVYSACNQKLLLDMVAKATDHKVTKHGAIEIHSWTDKHGGKTHTAAGAFYKPYVMVFASCEKGVAVAIDVLDGKSPGGPKGALAGAPPAGATVIVRSCAIPQDARCPISKQIESFRIAMGENDGKSFYRATAVMKTPETATQVKSIIDGFKALGTLRFSNDADVMKLVNGLQTTVQDKTLRIRWEASTGDVWTVIEKVAKKIEERIKKGGGKAHAKPGTGKHVPKAPESGDGT